MNITRKGFIIILFTILFIIVFMLMHIIRYWIPYKYCVKEENIHKYVGCILVQEVWHTGTGWEIVGNDKGLFDNATHKDIILTGQIPPETPVAGRHVNTYLCEVDYKGYEWVDNLHEEFEKYEVVDWYPIYPYKRDTILPSWLYPYDYMSRADLQ